MGAGLRFWGRGRGRGRGRGKGKGRGRSRPYSGCTIATALLLQPLPRMPDHEGRDELGLWLGLGLVTVVGSGLHKMIWGYCHRIGVTVRMMIWVGAQDRERACRFWPLSHLLKVALLIFKALQSFALSMAEFGCGTRAKAWACIGAGGVVGVLAQGRYKWEDVELGVEFGIGIEKGLGVGLGLGSYR